MLYAIHDALVRPYPGHKMGPSLAESWQESADGLTYEFKLRPGLKFHNGDPVTTEDVKFSFERYKGAGAKVLQEHVAQVEIVDPLVVRFHLKEPWPDFMTFYGTTASAAGIVVPEEVPRPGRRRRLQEASDRRRPLQVRQQQAGHGGRAGGQSRLLAPRAQRQDAGHEERPRSDHAGGDGEDRRGRHRPALDGPEAEEIRRDPRLQVVASKHASIFWIEFTEQWDPKSPWHDKRLRLAANLRARPQADQRGGVPRLLPAGRRDRAARHGLRAAGRAAGLRPGQGQAAARRGRLSERVRRRRVRRDPRLSDRGRGGGERLERGRHPRQVARDGARGVLRRLAGEEAARPVHDRGRQLRQRRQPGARRSSSPRAPTPTAAIPTSTSSSSSRRASATPRSARRCCTRSSSSRSTGRCSRRSWTCAR